MQRADRLLPPIQKPPVWDYRIAEWLIFCRIWRNRSLLHSISSWLWQMHPNSLVGKFFDKSNRFWKWTGPGKNRSSFKNTMLISFAKSRHHHSGWYFDTMLASYVLNAAATRHGMDDSTFIQPSDNHFRANRCMGAKQKPFNQIELRCSTLCRWRCACHLSFVLRCFQLKLKSSWTG